MPRSDLARADSHRRGTGLSLAPDSPANPGTAAFGARPSGSGRGVLGRIEAFRGETHAPRRVTRPDRSRPGAGESPRYSLRQVQPCIAPKPDQSLLSVLQLLRHFNFWPGLGCGTILCSICVLICAVLLHNRHLNKLDIFCSSGIKYLFAP